MKTYLIVAAVVLALAPYAGALNTTNFNHPYDADASTAYLYHFNTPTDPQADPKFVVNEAFGGTGMQVWYNFDSDPESHAFDTDVPNEEFGESAYISGDADWGRINGAFTQSGIDGIGTGGLTAEAWVKPAKLAGKQRFISMWGCCVLSLFDTEIEFIVWNADGLQVIESSNANLQVGQWYHVAGTYDGATLTAYVNGQPVASGAVNPSAHGLPTTADWMVLGATPWGADEALSGNLDEVRISSTVRSFTSSDPEPIVSTPLPGAIQEGGALTLAAPEGAVSYLWYLNGNAMADTDRITGTTSRVLTFSPVSAADEGTYTCVYDTGSGGALETAPFELEVLPEANLPACGLFGLGVLASCLLFGGAAARRK